jgi:hypothetical protein
MSTTTPHSTSHADIANLNFRYLMVVREIAQANRAEAMMRFGIEDELLEAIVSADTLTIEEMCQNGKVAFRPNISIQELSSSAHRRGLIKVTRAGVKRGS